MRTAAAAVATILLGIVLAVAAPAQAAEPGAESEFVASLNQIRADAGVGPLQVHDELVGVARNWADTMAAEGTIWHNPDLAAQVSADWRVLGENVGTGSDVPTLVQAFVDSEPHYRNIVDERFDWIGVGVTFGADGRMYTAHVFMDLRDATPAQPEAVTAPARPVATEPPAPAPAPAPPPPPVAPPAAVVPERVEAVLAAVRSLGTDGVA